MRFIRRRAKKADFSRLKKGETPTRRTHVASSDELNFWVFREIPLGHLDCPKCKKPWFYLGRHGSFLHGECRACSADVKINLSLIDFHPTLPNEALRCPLCQTNEFAIQVADRNLVIGCRDCRWEWSADLKETPSLILPPEPKLVV